MGVAVRATRVHGTGVSRLAITSISCRDVLEIL